jgi:hypothetical protein
MGRLKVTVLRLGRAAVAVGLASMGAAACGGPTEDAATVGASWSGETPVFSGPWATELLDFFQSTDSLFAKTALEDGVISEAELEEAHQGVTTCMEGRGLTDVVVNLDGSMSFDDPGNVAPDVDASNKIVEECEAESGWYPLAFLSHEMAGNPENRDVYEIMAECLVRVGLKESGYSAEDYKRDFEADAFDVWQSDTKKWTDFAECNSDPAGATGSG